MTMGLPYRAQVKVTHTEVTAALSPAGVSQPSLSSLAYILQPLPRPIKAMLLTAPVRADG